MTLGESTAPLSLPSEKNCPSPHPMVRECPPDGVMNKFEALLVEQLHIAIPTKTCWRAIISTNDRNRDLQERRDRSAHR